MTEFNAYIYEVFSSENVDPEEATIFGRVIVGGNEYDIEFSPLAVPESEREHIQIGAVFHFPIEQIRFCREQWTVEELVEHRRQAAELAEQLKEETR